MPTKHKTLTPDLEHLTGAESLTQLQAAMTRCLPNAVDHSSYKQNIFGHTGISEEFARWLLEYGANLDFQDAFGYTPLHHLAMDPNGAEQYQELWDYLVPGSEPCKSVQGEVIRINGRVSHEILDNGGANWDGDFCKMLKALGEYLVSGNALSEEEGSKVRQLIDVLQQGDVWENELNDLCRLSVQWVMNNLDPIPLGKTSYRR